MGHLYLLLKERVEKEKFHQLQECQFFFVSLYNFCEFVVFVSIHSINQAQFQDEQTEAVGKANSIWIRGYLLQILAKSAIQC